MPGMLHLHFLFDSRADCLRSQHTALIKGNVNNERHQSWRRQFHVSLSDCVFPSENSFCSKKHVNRTYCLSQSPRNISKKKMASSSSFLRLLPAGDHLTLYSCFGSASVSLLVGAGNRLCIVCGWQRTMSPSCPKPSQNWAVSAETLHTNCIVVIRVVNETYNAETEIITVQDVLETETGRDQDIGVMVSRRDRDVMPPARDDTDMRSLQNISRRSVETFKPWLYNFKLLYNALAYI